MGASTDQYPKSGEKHLIGSRIHGTGKPRAGFAGGRALRKALELATQGWRAQAMGRQTWHDTLPALVKGFRQLVLGSSLPIQQQSRETSRAGNNGGKVRTGVPIEPSKTFQVPAPTFGRGLPDRRVALAQLSWGRSASRLGWPRRHGASLPAHGRWTRPNVRWTFPCRSSLTRGLDAPRPSTTLPDPTRSAGRPGRTGRSAPTRQAAGRAGNIASSPMPGMATAGSPC
ncbi:hypothetical protein VTK73DRAFT_10335 [Phialemonium thermophilum]|uniref:Uncharacterized protein n=1 Tax=Phialemonium thermophilum TaxID=223376 RepID=A0ABR3VXD0_9PEZI